MYISVYCSKDRTTSWNPKAVLSLTFKNGKIPHCLWTKITFFLSLQYQSSCSNVLCADYRHFTVFFPILGVTLTRKMVTQHWIPVFILSYISSNIFIVHSGEYKLSWWNKNILYICNSSKTNNPSAVLSPVIFRPSFSHTEGHFHCAKSEGFSNSFYLLNIPFNIFSADKWANIFIIVF